jgi:hypothetical protein
MHGRLGRRLHKPCRNSRLSTATCRWRLREVSWSSNRPAAASGWIKVGSIDFSAFSFDFESGRCVLGGRFRCETGAVSERWLRKHREATRSDRPPDPRAQGQTKKDDHEPAANDAVPSAPGDAARDIRGRRHEPARGPQGSRSRTRFPLSKTGTCSIYIQGRELTTEHGCQKLSEVRNRPPKIARRRWYALPSVTGLGPSGDDPGGGARGEGWVFSAAHLELAVEAMKSGNRGRRQTAKHRHLH